MTVDSNTRNNLRAAIRAIEQVVEPAVASSGDQLATEQLGLVRANLAFLVERVHRLGERARFELDHYRGLAAEVAGVLAEHDRADERLDAAVADAAAVASDTGASADAVASSTVDLRAAVSRVVRGLRGEPGPMRDAVDARVLDAAHRMIEFERAWFLPQGWEPDPSVVRSLDDVLADARPTVAGGER